MGVTTRRALVTSVLLAGVLAGALVASVTVAGQLGSPSIESDDFEGPDVLSSADGVTKLWNNGSYTLALTVEAPENPYKLCAHANETAMTNCRYVRLSSGTNQLTVREFPWDENTTGRLRLNLTVRSAGSSAVHDSITREVLLFDPVADVDGDGLTNRVERARGTNMSLQDTDRDGLDDGAEVSNYDTDPLSADTDDDGLTDGAELYGNTDPTARDTDGDGLTDGREVNALGTDPTVPDTDGDGLTDGREVDELQTDPTLADTDGDGIDDGEEVADPAADPVDPASPLEATDTAAEGGAPPAIGGSTLLFAVVVLVGTAVAAASLYDGDLRTRLPGWDGGDGDDGDGEEPPAARTARAAEESSPGRPGTTSLPSASSASHSSASNTSIPRSSAATPSTPLLTDEERVLQLLHENDGQCKQQHIVAATDWSKSKVSRLLSRMAEDDAIEKITLGRENVIRLPREDDAGADTPPTGGDRS